MSRIHEPIARRELPDGRIAEVWPHGYGSARLIVYHPRDGLFLLSDTTHPSERDAMKCFNALT